MKYIDPGDLVGPPPLPPGVTQAQIAASLAANPQASLGGYVGVGTPAVPGPAGQTSYDPVANQPLAPPATAGGGSALAQIIHAMRSGYTPDYQALLASDPQLLQAQADVRGQLGTAAASRKAATAKILAQLGIVPDFASGMNALGLNSSYLSSDVDPTTAALAKQMTEQGLSTEAQLGHQHDVGVNSLVDALAARGVLRSGGLGVGLTSENQRDKQAHFDALRAALDAIGGAQGGYNQTVQDTAATLRGETESAVQRQIQLHPAVAGGQVDASYDASTGLYKDSDGNFYNADGTPTKPGAANASPVHPSNVAPPAAATESATTATFPQASAQTATPAAPAVPHATIPGAAPPLVSEHGQGGGYTAPPVPAAAPVPVPRPYGNPVVDDAPRGLPTGQAGSDPGLATGSWVGVPQEAAPRPVPRPTAWSNSVAKRLNMGF